MEAVMVSDAHLAGLDDPAQAALVAWLDAVSVPRVFLLGDVFHHWWGFPSTVMTAYVPICAALLRLRARGIALHMVPGNHDFAVGPFFREVLGATVSGPVVVTLGGRRFLLAHGDEADTRTGYRVTRTVLRSPVFAGVMRSLGPARGERLLRRLAGQSREHMQAAGPLVEQQRTWALEALREHGAAVAVLGHTHVAGAACDGRVLHLGAWAGLRSFLLVDDHGHAELRQVQPAAGWRGVPLEGGALEQVGKLKQAAGTDGDTADGVGGDDDGKP